MDALIQRFIDRFRGLEVAYGRYEVDGTEGSGKKKGSADTVRKPPTEDIWAGHLRGEGAGIGIVPINKESKCVWGAIDVDTYPLDLNAVAKEIEDAKLPLVPCRSKSGGAHLFLFLKKPTEAKETIKILKACAAKLGYASSEIFPKQHRIAIEEGDVGNWLNLPYYNGFGQTVRYGFQFEKGHGPRRLELKEFLDLADDRAIDADAFELHEETRKDGETEKGPFANGPPCLIALASVGVPEGGRNNALFNMGVYLRKAKPDTWKHELYKYNDEHLDPPLTQSEVGLIMGSLDRRDSDYGYKCNDEPCASFCNKDLCFTRKFGIGRANYGMHMGNLRKIDSDPPVYLMDVDGEPVSLSLDELHNFRSFRLRVSGHLNRLPIGRKQDIWDGQVSTMLDEMRETEGAIIPAAPSATREGRFKTIMHSFMQQCRKSDNLSQVDKRPILHTDSGNVYFTLEALERHINNTVDTGADWSPMEINHRLHNIGIQSVPNPELRGFHVYCKQTKGGNAERVLDFKGQEEPF